MEIDCKKKCQEILKWVFMEQKDEEGVEVRWGKLKKMYLRRQEIVVALFIHVNNYSYS